MLLLYNNDSRTSHANSDYRLLNRTPTSQTGKHNPKYTKDTSNGGAEESCRCLVLTFSNT
ncbi:MAG: glycoside hydrolase family 70 protein [Streptococcus salivarius]